jgi:hypothetical protein
MKLTGGPRLSAQDEVRGNKRSDWRSSPTWRVTVLSVSGREGKNGVRPHLSVRTTRCRNGRSWGGYGNGSSVGKFILFFLFLLFF